jgi:hypothetical protein
MSKQVGNKAQWRVLLPVGRGRVSVFSLDTDALARISITNALNDGLVAVKHGQDYASVLAMLASRGYECVGEVYCDGDRWDENGEPSHITEQVKAVIGCGSFERLSREFDAWQSTAGNLPHEGIASASQIQCIESRIKKTTHFLLLEPEQIDPSLFLVICDCAAQVPGMRLLRRMPDGLIEFELLRPHENPLWWKKWMVEMYGSINTWHQAAIAVNAFDITYGFGKARLAITI